MMRRVELKKGRRPGKIEKQRDTALYILAAAFLLGAILGALLEDKTAIEASVTRFLQEFNQHGVETPLWREVWITLRWPAGIFILTLFPFSMLTIPMLFLLRGFLLTYGVAAMIGSSMAGTLCAGLIFGPTCFLTVPVFFMLGTIGLLPPKEQNMASGHKGLCLAALMLCIFLNQTMVPFALKCFLRLTT